MAVGEVPFQKSPQVNKGSNSSVREPHKKAPEKCHNTAGGHGDWTVRWVALDQFQKQGSGNQNDEWTVVGSPGKSGVPTR